MLLPGCRRAGLGHGLAVGGLGGGFFVAFSKLELQDGCSLLQVGDFWVRASMPAGAPSPAIPARHQVICRCAMAKSGM